MTYCQSSLLGTDLRECIEELDRICEGVVAARRLGDDDAAVDCARQVVAILRRMAASATASADHLDAHLRSLAASVPS